MNPFDGLDDADVSELLADHLTKRPGKDASDYVGWFTDLKALNTEVRRRRSE